MKPGSVPILTLLLLAATSVTASGQPDRNLQSLEAANRASGVGHSETGGTFVESPDVADVATGALSGAAIGAAAGALAGKKVAFEASGSARGGRLD